MPAPTRSASPASCCCRSARRGAGPGARTCSSHTGCSLTALLAASTRRTWAEPHGFRHPLAVWADHLAPQRHAASQRQGQVVRAIPGLQVDRDGAVIILTLAARLAGAQFLAIDNLGHVALIRSDGKYMAPPGGND